VEIKIDDITNPEMNAFLDYWQSLRGPRFAPSWKEFDLLALDAKSIPYITVVDVHHDPLDFVFRFWGTAHVNAKGLDKTGKSVIDDPHFKAVSGFDEFKQVIDKKLPLAVQDTAKFPNQDAEQVPIMVLRLPLSDNGKDVDKVISLVRWELTRPPSLFLQGDQADQGDRRDSGADKECRRWPIDIPQQPGDQVTAQ